jgi:hypothetical protein
MDTATHIRPDIAAHAAPPRLDLQAPSRRPPLLRSRSANALLLNHVAANAARAKLLAHEQVRGVGGSQETFLALRAMARGRTVVLPLFWGFRKLEDGSPALQGSERHTMRAYLDLVAALGAHCRPLLILADEHARHNNIDEAIWRPYYAAVEQHAGTLGLRVRYLSDIFSALGLSGAALEEAGRALVERPSGTPKPGAIRLTGNEWSQLKRHAEHLCKRFPGQFPLPCGESQKRALYDPRALAYARFRAAEGRLLLPRLPQAFDGVPVLPVHVTGPESERFGVRGLAILARDEHGANTVHIPWK